MRTVHIELLLSLNSLMFSPINTMQHDTLMYTYICKGGIVKSTLDAFLVGTLNPSDLIHVRVCVCVSYLCFLEDK